MPPTPDQVRQYIADGLACEHIAVSSNDCVHFEALVVSSAFEGKRQVARHQLVYATLGDRIKGSAAAIHALALTTRTPAEYAEDQR